MREIVRELVAKNDVDVLASGRRPSQGTRELLAAARLLKKQGTARRIPLLDLILDDRGPSAGNTTPGALAMAARAEAFALKSRWKEAEEQYRLAIELIDDETIKRSWWFNLADIELEARRRKPDGRPLCEPPGRRRQRRHLTGATEIQRASHADGLCPPIVGAPRRI